VLKWIGGGSYGEVWLARNIMGIHRAIKVVRRARFESDKPYDREFEGLRNFEPVSRAHDGFMDILQVGRNDEEGHFFYVMEAADDELTGQSIESETYKPKTILSEFRSKGRLPFARCLQIALSLAESLQHLHEQGLVHRYIKPSNIIFVNGMPKLADIGLVTSKTSAATFIGAPGYIPPEGPGTPQGDVYALGKVLYEIVTGNDRLEYPKVPTNLQESDLEDFQELNEVILKACESDARRRYSSAERMREDLLLLQGGKSVRRLRRLERAWGRTKPVLLTLPVMAVIVLLVFLIQNWRMVAATAQTAAAEEQANYRRRGLLIQEFMLKRLVPHLAGWSSRAWEQASEAATIQMKGDSEVLRDQAAALLAGMDAHRHDYLTNFGASSVAFDREGKRLLMCGLDGVARLLEPATGSVQVSASIGPGPVTFTENGDPLALVFQAEHQALSLVNVLRSKAKLEWRIHGTKPLKLTALAAGGACAVAILEGADGHDVLEAFQADGVRSVHSFAKPVTALAISPDGSLVAAAESGGQVRVWGLRDGRLVATFPVDRNEVLCLALKGMSRNAASSGEGMEQAVLIAAGASGGNIIIWDLSSRATKTVCRGSYWEVNALAFSPDGTILASGGRGPVKLWDATTGLFLLDLYSVDFARGLGFSPDGKQLAVSTEPRFGRLSVSLWDLEFGRGMQILRGLASPVTIVAFSPDGSKLAALSHTWEVGLWDLATGQLLRVIEVPKGASADNAALALSRDGERLAFSAGTTAKLWNVQSGTEMNSWDLPPGLVDILGLPDQNRLLLFRVEGGVCRLRRLLEHGATELIAEIPGLNKVLDAAAALNGQIFIVRGLEGDRSGGREVVRAFDGLTGRELWSFPSTRSNRSTEIAADVKGKFVVFSTNDFSGPAVVELSSGAVARVLDRLPSAVCSEPAFYAVRGVRRVDVGCALFNDVKHTPLVTLGPDTELSFFPRFDSAGNSLAWGNQDGTVAVCDLKEIRRRMNGLGLGW
jgi:WD40 repeat protein